MRISTLDFVSCVPADGDAALLTFQPRRPLGFRAGQHALWQIPGGGTRPFSIASAPHDGVIALGTSLASGTRVKRALSALDHGSSVRLLGPLSSFCPPAQATELALLTQGMGVTPFRSILRDLHASTALSGDGRRRTSTTLVQVGVRHPFRTETAALVDDGRYVCSRDDFIAQVDDVVSARAGRTEVAFMVSGSAQFTAQTVRRLRGRGVSSRQIRSDAFWGYRAPRPEDVRSATGAGSTP